MKIKWPTERHMNIGEHLVTTTKKYGMGLSLNGSLATGNAGKYSDIDITIFGTVTHSIIEQLLYGVETPLMVNGSENPPGLLIVAYYRGLGLDIGFQTIGCQEADQDMNTIVLQKPIKEMNSNYTQPNLSKIARYDNDAKIWKLIHKGLLKYLNGKENDAREFIREITDFVQLDIDPELNTLDAFRLIIELSVKSNHELFEDLEWLMQQARQT